MTDIVSEALPGLVLRSKWAKEALGKSDRTAKRLQDAGRIVVRYIGKDPYVDIEATSRRLRGEDDRRRGRPRRTERQREEATAQ